VSDSLALPASRDPLTGDVYVPPRKLAADGSLRPCQPTTVPALGTLASWTEYGGEFYGLVDLADSVRIQTLLGSDPHQIGARYRGERDGAGRVRFHRD
jgi:hypothetical protein